MTIIGTENQDTKTIVFRPITDDNTRVIPEMLSGVSIDMMVEVPPISLSKFQGNDFSIAEQAGPHVWFCHEFLMLNRDPFSNKNSTSGR